MVFVADSLASDADFRDWLTQLAEDRSEEDLSAIRRACRFAKDAYADVFTPCGLPLFQHALGVADIVDKLRLDSETVIAALLFAVEDEAALCAQFGTGIAHLVDGVMRMGGISELMDRAPQGRQRQGQLESFRQMLLAMVEDMRAVLIKLAERAQTMRQLSDADETYQRKTAEETREIYAPLANRLGVWRLKWELEDLSFRYLEPERYRQIAGLIDERRVDRERYILEVTAHIRNVLADAGIGADVSGRPKHIYSIWRKMRRKKIPFSELYDVRAVRVLVDTLPQCYAALGVVHSQWQPIPGEFDDYISHPKGNNYQSLHTAVIGPEGKALEVQIRTRDMHRHAELGVAAHWRYKEGGKIDEKLQEKIAWVRQLLEWRTQLSDGELAEEFQKGLFQDTVYVLTPQDRVIALPTGSTPVDFAYHVHTELGHRCRGAKVDGRIVPLSYRLQQGQRVEILAAKEGGPSRDWLAQNLVASARARAKVRQWFKAMQGEDVVARGRALLEKEGSRQGVALPNLERTARDLRFGHVDQMLAAIGHGELPVRHVLNRAAAPSQEAPHPAVAKGHDRGAVVVGDADNLLYAMARCCHPLPPDPIVGYVSHGRGVIIHREDCPNVMRLAGDQYSRLLQARWQQGGGGFFETAVRIVAMDRSGLLRDLSDVFTREHCNVMGVNSATRGSQAKLQFTFTVGNGGQVGKILSQLMAVEGVESVVRL